VCSQKKMATVSTTKEEDSHDHKGEGSRKHTQERAAVKERAAVSTQRKRAFVITQRLGSLERTKERAAVSINK